MINFRGSKEELHNQFKIWCATNKVSMNIKVIDLIESLLKEKNKIQPK